MNRRSGGGKLFNCSLSHPSRANGSSVEVVEARVEGAARDVVRVDVDVQRGARFSRPRIDGGTSRRQRR
ncbi:MAG TPA: hypothetical protein VHC69_08290 [Polyangiaceae bacterium]|nr:hypothetical protein [Polyangiaceae bacterium]